MALKNTLGRYEGYSAYKTEDMKKALPGRDAK